MTQKSRLPAARQADIRAIVALVAIIVGSALLFAGTASVAGDETKTDVAPDHLLQTGEVWLESESGWKGVWTQIGSSSEYDAKFTHSSGSTVTSKLNMRVDRQNVAIHRWNPGTWGLCSYVGTFNQNRTAASGMYQCTDSAGNWTAQYPWNATISSSTAPPSAGEAFVGCYKDGDPRDLTGFHVQDYKITLEACRAMCATKGFTFAGTQYGSHCFCGNSYGKYGVSNDCTEPCAGNRGQICGGWWANSVYRVR